MSFGYGKHLTGSLCWPALLENGTIGRQGFGRLNQSLPKQDLQIAIDINRRVFELCPLTLRSGYNRCCIKIEGVLHKLVRQLITLSPKSVEPARHPRISWQRTERAPRSPLQRVGK